MSGFPGTDSAHAAAARWFDAIFERGDVAAAWNEMDPDYRLSMAQNWVGMNRDAGNDARALALADGAPTGADWCAFVSFQLGRWRPLFTDHFEPGKWGIIFADEEVVAGPDLEVVAIGVNGGTTERLLGDAEFVQFFTVRLRDRWRVAGLGRYVVLPGWPPSRVEVVALDETF